MSPCAFVRSTRREFFALGSQAGAIALSASSPSPWPGGEWERAADPSSAGFDARGLQAAANSLQSTPVAAVVVVAGGKLVLSMGEPDRVLPIHSCRKSILSVLFGPAVAAGKIKLDATLASLGVDDKTPLTPAEKEATVKNLLCARSGVYLPSNMAGGDMLRGLPARGSHRPGTHWYYNNWDLNALGTIYEKATGEAVFAALERVLVKPLAMQHFSAARDTRSVMDTSSIHAGYSMSLSALDMARFGLLVARGGRWRDQQLIPQAWIRESTSTHTKLDSIPGGYGYMWWTESGGQMIPGLPLPSGSCSAQGMGGHMVLVIPLWDTVVVVRARTDRPSWIPGSRLSGKQLGPFFELLGKARRNP